MDTAVAQLTELLRNSIFQFSPPPTLSPSHLSKWSHLCTGERCSSPQVLSCISSGWAALERQRLHSATCFSHVINPRCGDVFHNQNEAWHKVEQSQSNVTFYMSHERCFDNHGIMWQRIAFSIPVRWWMIVSSSHLLILTLSLQVGNFLWVEMFQLWAKNTFMLD